MPYSITILRSAEKALDKLARSQPKHAEVVEDAIEDVAADPRTLGCKPLTGLAGGGGSALATTGCATRSTTASWSSW